MEIIANKLQVFQGDIEEYEDSCKALSTHFQELCTHICDLNRMWEGEAHDVFMATFERDRQSGEELLALMQQMLAELRFAHEEYTSCETQVAMIINDSFSV